jgi:hypothetical protein
MGMQRQQDKRRLAVARRAITRLELSMTIYTLALFVHISALLAAIAASALSHFAESRMGAAQTVGDLREWGTLAGRVGKVFPLALLTLVATGAYMVSSAWAWNDGWIDVALGGVALLFIGGEFLGRRGKALGRMLEGDSRAPVSAAVRRVLRDPLTHSVSYATTTLSIGIVFVMVNKPSLLGALAALFVALAIGVALAALRQRSDSLHVPSAPHEAPPDESADRGLVGTRQ